VLPLFQKRKEGVDNMEKVHAFYIWGAGCITAAKGYPIEAELFI